MVGLTNVEQPGKGQPHQRGGNHSCQTNKLQDGSECTGPQQHVAVCDGQGTYPSCPGVGEHNIGGLATQQLISRWLRKASNVLIACICEQACALRGATAYAEIDKHVLPFPELSEHAKSIEHSEYCDGAAMNWNFEPFRITLKPVPLVFLQSVRVEVACRSPSNTIPQGYHCNTSYSTLPNYQAPLPWLPIVAHANTFLVALKVCHHHLGHSKPSNGHVDFGARAPSVFRLTLAAVGAELANTQLTAEAFSRSFLAPTTPCKLRAPVSSGPSFDCNRSRGGLWPLPPTCIPQGGKGAVPVAISSRGKRRNCPSTGGGAHQRVQLAGRGAKEFGGSRRNSSRACRGSEGKAEHAFLNVPDTGTR